jgi:hypothetical protein
MTRKRKRPQAARCDEISRRVAQGQPQDTVGLRVVTRIAGLACALLVCEAEQSETGDVGWVGTDLLLQLRQQRAPALSDCGCNPNGACLLGGTVRQHAAQQEGGGGQARRQPSEDEPLRRHYGFCWPLVLS